MRPTKTQNLLRSSAVSVSSQPAAAVERPQDIAHAATHQSYKFCPVSNYSHTAKEVSTNSSPEAFVRELLHNSYDADASWVRMAPLVGTDLDVVGMVMADNGHGMTRPCGVNGEGDLVDTHGHYPGINAFFDVGNSTRASEPDRVERKGHGSKLSLQSDKPLTLVTKAAPESDLWDVVQVENPLQHLLNSRTPQLKVSQLPAGQVEDMLLSQGDYAHDQGTLIGGFARFMQATNPASEIRVRIHIRDHVVRPFLHHSTGTLLVALGLKIKDLKVAMDELDTFTGYEPLTLAAGRPANNDKLRLPAYLRFKTICGHPLHEQSLAEANFLQGEIGAEKKVHTILNDASRLSHFDFQILTKGPDDAPESSAYTLKKIPMGFPYIPLRSANEQRQRGSDRGRKNGTSIAAQSRGKKQQGANSSKRSEEGSHIQYKSNDPATITEWNNASFQERYLQSFRMPGGSQKRYTLQLDVIGKFDRLNTWSMLNRRGGQTQKRSGIAIGEFSGVLLFANGVYTCRFSELLDMPQLAEYSELKLRIEHWDLKIIGDMALKTDRDSVAAPTKELLEDMDFLDGVKRVLDNFKGRNNGVNMFAHLVRRVNKDCQMEAAQTANEHWSAKAQQIQSQQERLVVSLRNQPYPMIFLQPGPGEENGVIHLYSALCGRLPDDHFVGDLECLKKYWPPLLSVSGAAGIDSFGIDRDDVEEVDFESMDMPVPPSYLKSIEFKRTFHIPSKKPNGGKASSGCYNHPWPLTDLLICWDMKWDRQHQALNDKIQVVEGTYLYDKHGNAGRMSEQIVVDGQEHTVPESMQGYSFFVHRVKNREGMPAEYPQHRVHNTFTQVVCLKRLIQVTFSSTVSGRPVGKVTWAPKNTSPDCMAIDAPEPADDEVDMVKSGSGSKKKAAGARVSQVVSDSEPGPSDHAHRAAGPQRGRRSKQSKAHKAPAASKRKFSQALSRRPSPARKQPCRAAAAAVVPGAYVTSDDEDSW